MAVSAAFVGLQPGRYRQPRHNTGGFSLLLLDEGEFYLEDCAALHSSTARQNPMYVTLNLFF